jgi:anti-anti-sigma factor
MTFEQDGLAGLGWDGHLLLLHGSEAERRTQVAEWVQWGLERDEQVIYGQDDTIADGQDDTIEPHRSVLAVLGEHGIDVQTATAEGRLLVLPPNALYGAGANGLMTRIECALAEGYRAVRTSGEVSAARTGAPEEVYPGLAYGLEWLCRTQPVSALCQYEHTSTVGTRLEQATAAHVGGIREAQLHTAETRDGLLLAGEVDASNELVLLSAVQAASSIAVAVLWLDLRRVAFLSVGGCRALAVGTQRFRERGGRVVLLVSEGIVARAVRLVELDALMKVELVELMETA